VLQVLPEAFNLLTISILVGLIAAICAAGWLQWVRMNKALRELKAVNPLPSRKGSNGPANLRRTIVRQYATDAYIGLIGFGVIAADLAYAVLTSVFGAGKFFVEALFILAGFGGIAMLWISAYLTSRLVSDLRDEGAGPAPPAADR